MGTTATGKATKDSIDKLMGKISQTSTQGDIDVTFNEIAAVLLGDNSNPGSPGGITSGLKPGSAYADEQVTQDIVDSYPGTCKEICDCENTGTCCCEIWLAESKNSKVFEPKKEDTTTVIEAKPYIRMSTMGDLNSGDFEKYYLYLKRPGQDIKGKITPESEAQATTPSNCTRCSRSHNIVFNKTLDDGIKQANTFIDNINKTSSGTEEEDEENGIVTCKQGKSKCYRKFFKECGKTPCVCSQVKELSVGSYGDEDKKGVPGDQLTPHHMPADSYMNRWVLHQNWFDKTERKVNKEYQQYRMAEGVTLNMLQARHEQTFTFKGLNTENEGYYEMSPLDALAEDIVDVRTIYSTAGQYDSSVQNALKLVWKLNTKTHFPLMYRSRVSMDEDAKQRMDDYIASSKANNRKSSLENAENAQKKAELRTGKADDAFNKLEAKDPKPDNYDERKAKLLKEQEVAKAELAYLNAQVTCKNTGTEESFQEMAAKKSDYLSIRSTK